MAKKSSSATIGGGVLLLLGSLVYLYVLFTWVSKGAESSAWLSAAQFFGPFAAAVAVVAAIALFFMSIGTMAGKMQDDMSKPLWKFIILAGVTTLVVTGGGGWFWAAVVGFVLTYLGGMGASM